MAYRLVKLGSATAAVAAAALVGACSPSVSSLSCDRIGEEAKQISQAQPLKITNLINLRETSRTDTEARCQGTATMSNGQSGDLYLRAYAAENATRVEYSSQPFGGGQGAQPAQPPQPAPPPATGVPGYDQPAQQPPPAQGEQ
jgi:hypothetical protein